MKTESRWPYETKTPRFWQRCAFTPKGSGTRGIVSDYFSQAYMGSSEFEWGAKSQFLRRMWDALKKKELVIFGTGVFNDEGKEVVILCRYAVREALVTFIREVADRKNRAAETPLKERANFWQWFVKKPTVPMQKNHRGKLEPVGDALRYLSFEEREVWERNDPDKYDFTNAWWDLGMDAVIAFDRNVCQTFINMLEGSIKAMDSKS